MLLLRKVMSGQSDTDFAGQAEVINERCIGCGNCTRVCSQGAKTYLSSVREVDAC
jgi:ferredoxin